jgi:glycerophosphoryl diester phosphodiesterase
MPIPLFLENSFQWLADTIVGSIPTRFPSEAKLRNCRLVAHRGEFDNRSVRENTLAAFEKAEAAGVWGIECDVRWTSDGVPVIIHDPDLQRMFNLPMAVDQIPYRTLQSRCPLIPSLAMVVERFGKRLHLMIEVKQSDAAKDDHRIGQLEDVLSVLQPVENFHLMALEPHLLSQVKQIPKEAFAAIAYKLPQHHSAWVLQNGWGAICGHYLLLSRSRIKSHQRSGQRVGSGFAASPNVMFRELNRGVDWIFSNNAATLQRIIHRSGTSVSNQATDR